MDLRQLRTFCSVAELGSLSKAADRLHMAQPTLSRQIKLLEHELRVELFLRDGRGMTLTSAGQTLLDRTAGLVRQIEQVRDDIQSASGAPAGRVVLGLVPTVSAVLAARFAKTVVDAYPDISLRIIESYGGHLVEWLHRGEMDLAITYGPAVDLHLAVRPIGREEVCVVGPPGCGLKDRGEVTLEWLAEQKLVLPSVAHGMRILIDRALARKGLNLSTFMEADSYHVQVRLVEAGLCYTILPASALAFEIEAGRLEIAYLAKPALTRELILASPVAQSSIATNAIANVLLSDIRKLAMEGTWNIKLDHTAA